MNPLKIFFYNLATRNKEKKVFDWDTAARLIKKYNVRFASFGFAETASNDLTGIIYNFEPVRNQNCKPTTSSWATPVLYLDMPILDLDDEDMRLIMNDEVGVLGIRCYVMESERPEWADKKAWYPVWWPLSALEVLKKNE